MYETSNSIVSRVKNVPPIWNIYAKTNESFYIAFQAEVYTLSNIYFNIRHST